MFSRCAMEVVQYMQCSTMFSRCVMWAVQYMRLNYFNNFIMTVQICMLAKLPSSKTKYAECFQNTPCHLTRFNVVLENVNNIFLNVFYLEQFRLLPV